MLDAVMPIPLLKVFMVVDNPFWEDNRPANQYAYTVPSREVHYWKSGDKRTGLLMLYSDRPSNQFWTDYLTNAFREDLLPVLGPQLIESHLKSGTSHELKVARRRQDEAITWSWQSDEALQGAYDKSGSGWTISKFGNDRLLRTFLSYVRENHAESVSDDRVLAAGLRDWGLKPFVGACHAWRSGTDPTLVINYLKAFSMLPSVAKANCRLHVCGEAYSDYQGFIEGALRSAAEVLTSPAFGISKDDLRVRDRRLGRTATGVRNIFRLLTSKARTWTTYSPTFVTRFASSGMRRVSPLRQWLRWRSASASTRRSFPWSTPCSFSPCRFPIRIASCSSRRRAPRATVQEPRRRSSRIGASRLRSSRTRPLSTRAS